MSEQTTLLVIDDDAILVKALHTYLTMKGYVVYEAFDGPSGLLQLCQVHPHLIVLDVMMPHMSGWEVCRRIRRSSPVPIVILTARSEEEERALGLNLGADDYVLKPFSLRELEARIASVLRRCARNHGGYRDSGMIYAGDDLVIDSRRGEVRREGDTIVLTPTEMRFMLFVAQNANRVLTHQQLLENVWGQEYTGQTDYVKLLVWRLRHKIEPAPEDPQFIVTERGLGYRFCTD